MLWLLIAGIGAVLFSHVAPFPFLLDRFAPAHSVWHMPRDSGPPTIYLTYDDGPNPTATPDLLDVLWEARVRATFFLIDAHVTETTAPLVRRMFAEGHGVALHANTRALMVMAPGDLAELLTRNADRIAQLTGHRPCRLFRPHAGWRSGAMYEALVSIDHRLVGWSWGLWDWNWYRPREAAGLAERLTRRAAPGDIIVMHDGHHANPSADRRYAVEATRQIVGTLRSRGYQFGALCDPARDIDTPHR
jgi:peptidoglycan/xylan/chitin deacetylase (PgdA/CDA1 family)